MTADYEKHIKSGKQAPNSKVPVHCYGAIKHMHTKIEYAFLFHNSLQIEHRESKIKTNKTGN
jgi:hypothetical protein